MSNTSNYQFLANIILRGKIKVETGLHIGGSKDKFEIGGVDNPVIRDPFTGYPYIPGSSLKGKMRMLLEFEKGVVMEKMDNKGNVTYPPSSDEAITILFGSSAEDSSNGPTRLIVRDAYPDEETIEMWRNLDSETLYAEYKAENTIDRMTSAATPRWMERVVKDSKFNFEIVIGIYSMDKGKDKDHYKDVKTAMKLLEDSTLGGGGSRGSGKVSFVIESETIYKKDYYLTGTGEVPYNEETLKTLF